MDVKALRLLLRRRVTENFYGPAISASTFLNDEQFEVLESGTVWDEAAEQFAPCRTDSHA